MAKPDVPVHYLRPNDKVWTPPAVAFFDTEAVPIPGRSEEVLALKLWAAHLIDRRPQKSKPPENRQGNGDTAAQLADWVDGASKGRATLWVFAHNLSFDFTTTRLPLLLVARGWEITEAAIGGRAPWLRVARGKRRITFADSGSWLPMALESVGEAVGIGKPALPDSLDTRQAWLARCTADVDILTAAMMQIMDWWDHESLGRFTITGASCGWNAYRHMPVLQRVVVDPKPELVKADRLAVHGGRRGVWRVGQVRVGPLIELDFTGAYPTVAAHLPLPLRRTIAFQSMDTNDRRLTSERWGVIANVTLSTETPRYPVRIAGATWYPTGTFTADLAGPEIAAAQSHGDLVSVNAGHVHQLGHAMLPWARWCLSVQGGELPSTPAVAQLVAKHWGRSVIGKWAGHSFERTELGPSPVLDWGYEEGWDHASQSRGGMVDIGGRRWWVAASAEPDNAYPGVLAWVESYVRVRLNRAIEAIGPRAIIQCDTDGFIVAADLIGTPTSGGTLQAPTGMDTTERLERILSELRAICAPLDLRVKRTFPNADIIGPQHYTAGGERRFAGLPKHATQRDDGKWVAKTWPKLQWQMTNGSAEGYTRPQIERSIVGPFAAGWVTTTGHVIPPRATVGPNGDTALLPWGLMPSEVHNHTLAPIQHPTLTRLL